MSAYDYSDRAKPASAHTKAVNAQLAHELGLEGDAPAWRELELAREGLVRAAEDLVIRDGDGHVIWDLDAFRFLQSPVPDERVNPSLWMSGRANLIAGLFEVVPEKIELLGRCQYNELPFEINRSRDADEALRLKYRYLDLRNPAVKQNIILRCQVVAALRAAIESCRAPFTA